MESSRQGSKKDTVKYVAVSGQLCPVFLLDPLVPYQCRSLKSVRCILSVGRQDFSLRTVTFSSAVTTSRVTTTCMFSKFRFPIISAKEIRGLKFSGQLNSNKD